MEFDLRAQAFSRTLIVAHRGVSGGNIPCNTIAAFDAALCQGADMVELDVAASSDGELFVFHPGMEPAHLLSERLIRDMPAREVRQLRFVNQDHTATALGVNTLDEALEHLKGRCYINIDKYWEHAREITAAIRRHDMARQILLKGAPQEALLEEIEQIAPDIAFMAILRERDEWSDRLLGRALCYVGAEAVFEDETSVFASREYVTRMRQKGLLVWVNSIVYDHRVRLTAGHDDDVSVIGRPDEGWGWLLARGYELIQTDWPLALRRYMETRAEGGAR